MSSKRTYDESNNMQVDQDQDEANQPGTSTASTSPSSTSPTDEDAVMLERVRRMKRARQAVDAYVNNILYEMMRRSGVEIPREELEQGFEDYCLQNNTGGLRIPDHLKSWWNLDDRHRRQDGPSEE